MPSNHDKTAFAAPAVTPFQAMMLRLDKARTKLDRKALKAAWETEKELGYHDRPDREIMEAAIATYLAALASAPAEAQAVAWREPDFIGTQPVLCVHGWTDPNNLCPRCEAGEEPTPTAPPELEELRAEVERLTEDRNYWKIEAQGETAKVEYRDKKLESAEAERDVQRESKEYAQRCCESAEARLELTLAALEPFALISSEGIVKQSTGHVTVTTCAEYFHRAAVLIGLEDCGAPMTHDPWEGEISDPIERHVAERSRHIMTDYYMSGPEEGDTIDQSVFVCNADGDELIEIHQGNRKELGRKIAELLNEAGATFT